LSTSEDQKNRALEAVKNLDTQKVKMFEETQERAKVKQLELEREIEEKSRNYEQTIQEIQEKSEE
jgi:hypothetical protein